MLDVATPTDAYCGPPPVPAEIVGAWNLDPYLLAALAIAGVAGFGAAAGPRRKVWFGLGFSVLCVAFISPLCALSAALFSARAGHHVLLISLAAPMLAMALPRFLSWRLVPAAAFHTAVLWFWHWPGAYAAALSHDGVYWAMELSLLLSAIAFWRTALDQDDLPSVSAAFLGIMMQMSLLGALLTFATTPLYTAHFETTIAWGLSPLTDQQLAGLIMWVPGALPYFAAGLLALRPLFAPSGQLRS
jgi:putative membrane protein